MVLKVTAQPEADMLRVACDFKFPESELVKRDAFGEGASIWKCATHTPGGIVYWVGLSPSRSNRGPKGSAMNTLSKAPADITP